MDDFVLNVRQIGNYPEVSTVGPNDLLLLQQNGLGGAYASIAAADLVANALLNPRNLNMALNTAIVWPGGNELNFTGTFTFNNTVNIPTLNIANGTVSGSLIANSMEVNSVLTVGGIPVLTTDTDLGVTSFNFRTGDIQLTVDDVLRAGAAPITNPHFNGWVTAPTSWNAFANDDTVATTAWVQLALCAWYDTAKDIGTIVTSINGRGGDVVLDANDITIALTVPGQYGQANTPPMGDASNRIATTLFVDQAMFDLQQWTLGEFTTFSEIANLNFAPINSPQFTGIPTGPTAAQTVNSGQLATTAFVHAAVTASTTGVSSFNTRTGAVVLTGADVTGAGGALLAGPTFTGIPSAPTATLGTNTTQLATTAFVLAEIAALTTGVTSFNARTGAVTLTTGDVTAVGAALLASPVFTGTPQAPTATPGTSTPQIATTQFVTSAIAAIAAPVQSFNGRTGAVNLQSSDVSAVGGALLASPAFSGNPTATTQIAGTSNTTLATTAFVQAALGSVVSGVSSYNGRTGAVVPIAADITGVGGALIASPTFTGIPAAPTATVGTNSTQLATTAFVQAALAQAPGGVSSFNGRTGAITLQGTDISAAGGALLSSPALVGTPTAPTPSPGNNSTNIATTAFVATAIQAAGGVASFNGRAGNVTLTSTDIANAEGAIYMQQDTAPATTPATFWFDSLRGQLYVNYIDPVSSAKSWVIANSVTAPAPTPSVVGIRTFTTSGTYVPSAGMLCCIIECVGGGGSGGNVTGTTGYNSGAGGGGSGGYTRAFVTAAQVGASQTVTIGAGGALGAQAAGGTTSVGSLCVAAGGGASAGAGPGQPAAPGSGVAGTLACSGSPGWGGSYTQYGVDGAYSGNGGSGYFGGGGIGLTWANNSNGLIATGYGSGGSGAMAVNITNTYQGGAGQNGICIITEYA